MGMTTADLDAIARRALASSNAVPTDGVEIRSYDYTPTMLAKIQPGGGWHTAACVAREGDETVLALCGPIGDLQSEADATFYSCAKRDVIALFNEVQRLRNALLATTEAR